MPKTHFSPSKNGFLFANYFINTIANVPGVGTLQTAGRCGGMAYCALDHFAAGLTLPQFRGTDFGAKGVPSDGTALADYIYQRQIDSFLTLSAIKLITWTLAPDAGNFLTKGVTRRTKEDEWKRLRESIDRGVPVPIALIVARDLGSLGKNHQVVAYGYDVDVTTKQQTVYIYDVNWPELELALVSGRDDAGWQETSPAKEKWRGWFVQDYAPRRPPPDLAKGAVIAAATKALESAIQSSKTAKQKGRGRKNMVTVTFKQLSFTNPEEPISAAELALEFAVNDQTVRWPARGLRKVKHGTKVGFDRSVDVTVGSAGELVIRGKIAGGVATGRYRGF